MSEIQIGLSKNARPTYSLDDVALIPTRRTRDRRDVDRRRDFGLNPTFYNVTVPMWSLTRKVVSCLNVATRC